MNEENPDPKIHVDTDWKAEAQAEKERLAAEAAKKADEPGGEGTAPAELPEPDFKALMGLLASQAIMGLGAYTDPKTGGVVVDLVGSKFAIDLLGVLEEKTEGNITEDEAKELAQVLAELRVRFVQVADAVAKQAATENIPGSADPNTPPPNVIETS